MIMLTQLHRIQSINAKLVHSEAEKSFKIFLYKRILYPQKSEFDAFDSDMNSKMSDSSLRKIQPLIHGTVFLSTFLQVK